MTEFIREQQKLEQTIKIISELLGIEQKELERVYNDYSREIDERLRVANFRKNHIKVLEKASLNPYFARIDFKAITDSDFKEIYIGRNGISKDGKVLITDWRAPISSLYYDSSTGKTSYKSPTGDVLGEVALKRQYDIENGKLIEYFDVDLVSSDNLLQKYLNANNDSRLKSIVATIQSEQNDIIRRPIDENVIIQGVAGSGKTTVALHKIAYLVYNYINSVKQSQYLVIGPNPVFIKYIKTVLPDLDVSGVSQLTFEQFAKDYIGEEIEINPSNKKISASIAGKSNDIDKFKSSMLYKNMLENFFELYLKGIVSKPLKLNDFVVLTEEEMAPIFARALEEQHATLQGRVDATIERLIDYVKNNVDSILTRYNEYENNLFKNASLEERESLRKKFIKERIEIQKNCSATIRKYFAKAVLSPIKLYRLFISMLDDFNIYGYKKINELKKTTMANIKGNKYDFEDLAALLYLKLRTEPNRQYSNIKHTVIDEAQDLGIFNFYVLKKCLPTSTFSIFGDLAQSIYDYRGIDNWDEVNSLIFNNKANIVNFNKSYRTTASIMNVADAISESINLGKSDLVVRQGLPVSFDEASTSNELVEQIANKIKEYKEKGYKTIAVISKTDLLSRYINDDLRELGIAIPNVTEKDDVSLDEFSVCTISNQLAKGLEFDAVILNNVNDKIYSCDSTLDMKLLYVAVTRALHELDITYNGKIPEVLQKFVTEKSKQKKL
ncbi:MAG: UvrD-helicase domain-containing protein [Acholeplasma sp.]|nr:UvrD-helicase domain-containing protein [Acholeplasma sp.]